MKLIYIKWFDASYNSDIQTLDEMNDEYIIESVGFFARETKKCITLSAEIIDQNPTAKWRYIHHIPKVNIIKKKIFKLW